MPPSTVSAASATIPVVSESVALPSRRWSLLLTREISFLERLALFARQRSRILQQPVPRPRMIALLIDLTFDLGDAIANLLARADRMQSHLPFENRRHHECDDHQDAELHV